MGEIADAAAGIPTGNLGGASLSIIERKGMKRRTRGVLWETVKPVVEELEKTGLTRKILAELAGLGASTIYEAEKFNHLGLSSYYALVGLLHTKECKTAKEVEIDFDDAAAIFDAARLARKHFPSRAAHYMRIMNKAAQQMLKASESE